MVEFRPLASAVILAAAGLPMARSIGASLRNNTGAVAAAVLPCILSDRSCPLACRSTNAAPRSARSKIPVDRKHATRGPPIVG
jgi:hypothetical protein